MAIQSLLHNTVPCGGKNPLDMSDSFMVVWPSMLMSGDEDGCLELDQALNALTLDTQDKP
jgi:hypothetical protein